MYTDSRDLEFTIRNHLDAGEKLIWAGRPKSGILLRPSDVFLIPFSLLWGGFVIFWEYLAISNGAPFFFALFGIPFIVVGLYLIFGRFLFDAYRRKKTAYALSDKRIIIFSGLLNQTINSYDIHSLTNLSVAEKTDGSGTILLGNETSGFSFLKNSGWPNNKKLAPTLEMIPEARKVYRLITESQAGKYSHLI